ncbi:BamA/TamA family outer membrane protein [Sphingobacterium sp. SYP-B4668]|uniref:BamA/TamA family outer membrane protein n=1 Tax=Sphingobacterium sp. SYP-B4668 TaxID=2996035 RepID=UPI0022DD8D28|nr:BamA/TamA family outer membrane protein [Sphingobacterium sp. SYP-B4668]
MILTTLASKTLIKRYFLRYLLSIILLLGVAPLSFAQHDTSSVVHIRPQDTLISENKTEPILASTDQYDISDLFVNIFHPRREADRSKKRSPITIMPNVAYNPTIGAQGGIKAVAGKVLGNQPNTTMSVGATSASITTKGIMVAYLSHNIFTPGNKWNLQGSMAVVRMVAPDAGIGMNMHAWTTEEERIIANPERNRYGSKYNSYVFNEKIYRQVADGLFLGAGVSFDMRRKIEEPQLVNGPTPPYLYSIKHGFDPKRYNSNGLLFNVQYMTRDHPNRAYKGIYTDVGIRVNQTWMGSSKNAIQMVTDFRKYFSFSTQHPDHLLAFWYWGSYRLSGTLPYFDLPGTSKDTNVRTGRGYTIGYFKGISFAYSEVEYRFPIMANKFLSGVTFFNMQSASDEIGTKLFQRWQPGGGAGLRVLFNKATRTNLCLDYAFGKYGNRGFFLGLNEAF